MNNKHFRAASVALVSLDRLYNNPLIAPSSYHMMTLDMAIYSDLRPREIAICRGFIIHAKRGVYFLACDD